MSYWFADTDNVNELARYLHKDKDCFGSIDRVLEYFSKPWHFENEWAHMNSREHRAKDCIVCIAESGFGETKTDS